MRRVDQRAECCSIIFTLVPMIRASSDDPVPWSTTTPPGRTIEGVRPRAPLAKGCG